MKRFIKNSQWLGLGFAALLLVTGAATVQASGESTEDLAKASQNPIANLISLPFHYRETTLLI